MLQKLRKNNQKGFTLIELMIVIAIIGILAAIAIPNFLSYRTKGQNSAAMSAAKNFYNTAVAYFSDTTTGTTEVTTSGAPSWTPDPNVAVVGGNLQDNGGVLQWAGAAMTFSHTGSTTTYTLDLNGNVSAP
jgi:type IV pilus assembly protein PilA